MYFFLFSIPVLRLFSACSFCFYVSLSFTKLLIPMTEFNEFEPRLKSTKNQFQLSAGLNLEKLNTILNEAAA